MKVVSGRLSAFDPDRNGITAGRLLLALLVIVSHTAGIGLFGPEPMTETGPFSLGFGAVMGFFALSGFLLARSRERTPSLAFIRNRCLRILPGYWLALLFGGFVVGPIGAVLVGQAPDPGSALTYVASNLGLLVMGQDGVAPAFARINGSLWTLSTEAAGYLLLAFIPPRFVRVVAAAELGLMLAVWALRGEWMGGYVTLLLLAFTFGICAWHFRARIPMSLVSLGGSGLVAAVAFSLELVPVAGLAISYTALGLAWLPIRVDRDLSYGVYVLAYPLQQLLALTVVPTFGFWPLVCATVMLVLPLAFLSWTFVERPALRLRHLGVSTETPPLVWAAPLNEPSHAVSATPEGPGS